MQQSYQLALPTAADQVLLHSCCAPCSAAIMTTLLANEIKFTVFFYNPNIYPVAEYNRRKAENMRFADKHHVPFVDYDYDPEQWLAKTKPLALEPERGARCTLCFTIRLQRAALYSVEHGFSVFTTSLGISRHKDATVINNCGLAIAAQYPKLTYWSPDWRKTCNPQLMAAISKQENFYRQQYCGCQFSLPKANQ